MNFQELAASLGLIASRATADEKAEWDAEDTQAVSRIENLRAVRKEEIDAYLDAAQRIAEQEEKRRSGAEARATAFIAAIATLVPLITWALGNTPPACDGRFACGIWTLTFDAAVLYLVVAAFWSLRTLAVARFHSIGATDIASFSEQNAPIRQRLFKETLSAVRRNQEVINLKMDFIRTAQRALFTGLSILALLLALDPWFRFVIHKSGPDSSITKTCPAGTSTPDRQSSSQGLALLPACALERPPTH